MKNVTRLILLGLVWTILTGSSVALGVALGSKDVGVGVILGLVFLVWSWVYVYDLSHIDSKGPDNPTSTANELHT